MCGICGIYEYGTTAGSVDPALLVKMSDTIRHRGPDDSGTFVSADKRTGFGFRRLSIVDLSPAANQPMSTPDGTITIVFNGEIYNHLVLRKELDVKGYRYRSRSDTESILYAYQEYGVDVVHKLLGMFAFAIWDEGQKRLLVARDRVGMKPLYYSFTGGRFIFGSEIKAILQHPSLSRELNEEALEYYLTYLISPAPLTMFKNIHKLEPGHLLIVGKDGDIRKEQYWNPIASHGQPSIDVDGTPINHSPLANGSERPTEEEAIRTIRLLLKQSVKDRMMSDVPFGVFLSGGIDSSTNVALMAELMDRPVSTFSVGFRQYEKYNELGYARQIAREFKTNQHEVIIDHNDAFDFLPKLIHHQDEPLADPVSIPLYFVSKLARERGTIVVQVGEGSDEQFAGYSAMLRELRFYKTLWKVYQALPAFARTAVYKSAAPILSRTGSYLALEYIRKGCMEEELFWGGAINFTETHKQFLFNGYHRQDRQSSHRLARRWHTEALQHDPAADYLKRMIYVEFKHRLPELLLMRVDKVSMATSVEARVPFLDHRLVEYSMTIPARLKTKHGETKYILKKAVEGIIPENIIYRRKQGFAVPVNEWFRDPWLPYLREKLSRSTLMRTGHFNQDFIEHMINRHIERRSNEGQQLWNLLNLSLWYEYWIEGKSL